MNAIELVRDRINQRINYTGMRPASLEIPDRMYYALLYELDVDIEHIPPYILFEGVDVFPTGSKVPI